MHLDIHILHTVPYANLNRDDIGRPKEGRYGGVPRIRVSSQSWKRAIRLATDESLVRSRRIPEEIAENLHSRGWDPDAAQKAAGDLLNDLTKKSDNKDGKPVLMFLHRDEITDLTDLLDRLGDAPSKKDLAAAKKQRNEIVARPDGSLALFGRMFANASDLNIDASLQVAHALSTHAGRVETDWFTAVDDLNPAEDSGAGHLDSADYASATFYRYLTINISDLRNRVGDDQATELLRTVLPAIGSAMPSGKQNTTAPFTPPDVVALVTRRMPMSYVAAFEQPVQASTVGGYAAASMKRLDTYADEVAVFTGQQPQWAGWAALPAAAEAALGHRYPSLPELYEAGIDHAMKS